MNLYLRNVITEGPDKGYAFAVKTTMETPACWTFTGCTCGKCSEFETHIYSLPAILVHPSYLENHKVGWMLDDWEYQYEASDDSGQWHIISEGNYFITVPSRRRKVIVPRSSNLEDAGEVFPPISLLIPGTQDSEINDDGHLAWSLKQAMDKGSIPVEVSEPFERWLKITDIKLSGEEAKAASVIFLAGMVAASQNPTAHPTQGEDKREGVCAADHISIEVLLTEFKRRGIDTTNWDGDQGAERAIVDGVCTYIADYVLTEQEATTPPNKEGERGEKEAVEEWIICAANHYDDDTVHNHQPVNVKKGFVTTGRRHHNCISTFAQIAGFPYSEHGQDIHNTEEQGFLTNLNRFVDRKEAFKIASAAGQITGPNKGQSENSIGLTSEDLY